MTVEDGDSDAVTAFRAEKGSPEAVAGCHTALVGGYVIEGDVPRADIDRLLSDRPDAVGLAVPGMPLGSPGMEFGQSRDAFDDLWGATAHYRFFRHSLPSDWRYNAKDWYGEGRKRPSPPN